MKLEFFLKSFLVIYLFLCSPSKAHEEEAKNSNIDNEEWVDQMFRLHDTSELLPEFDDCYGVVFRDLNDDKFADLYIVRFRNLNRFFINPGPGLPFEDFTISSGLGGNLMPRGGQNLELGASAADFDNNGLPDILIIGWGVATTLFRQDSKLQFTRKPLEAIYRPPLDANGGFWADINIDGNLDLFITDEHGPNRLFINEGFGKLSWATDRLEIITPSTISQGASFADLDSDGYPDLYVCNWFFPDFLYHNIGGERFELIHSPIAHLSDSLSSNGITFGDIDNDGDLDFIVTDRDRNTHLYRNDQIPSGRDWYFTEITITSGLINPYPAYGSVIADLNNDGWQDIFFTNIGPNQLFLNTGGEFKLAYEEKHLFTTLKENYSTGAAVADFDNDGDLDLFVSNKDTNSILYWNPLNKKNFLRFGFEGVKSNRDAIGAKVWLYEEGNSEQPNLIGYREISGGSGYLSFSEPIAHFGVLPEKSYRAKILFPSGIEIIKENLTAGTIIYIDEFGGIKKTFSHLWHEFLLTTSKEYFWLNLLLFLCMLTLVGTFLSLAMNRYGWRNKQIIYFLVIILVILYLLFLLLSGSSFLRILLSQIGFVVLFISVTIIFMEQIRKIELRRFGYRKTLQDFSEQLIFIKDNAILSNQLVVTIQNSLNVKFCVLFEIQNGLIMKRAVAGELKNMLPELIFSEEQKNLVLEETILTQAKLEKIFPNISIIGARLAISLSSKNCLFAIIFLGKPQILKEFAPEDLSLLRTLANQAAIAIENNRYIEETKELTQKITESEIQKKYVEELEQKNQRLQELYQSLKETQSQLIQSEKMASLGQLVAGIAHELNNPISFVYANMKELENYLAEIDRILTTIKSQLVTTSDKKSNLIDVGNLQSNADIDFIQKDIKDLIKESLEGSHRVKDVVQNLKNFSRLDEAEIKPVDLHEGLESTLTLLGNELKNRIIVHKNYGTIPLVECQPGHINQVFMNILINAIQAIGKNGDIWISTKTTNEKVEITIRDNGKGIPEEIRNKIFDPFFTTKPVGEGTGLGLSINYGIIEKHGGTIELESEVGKGTKFIIILPAKSHIKKERI
jgi:signal transduction histidine kinase